MNKTDLVNAVAEVVSTKKEAQQAVDTVFSAITEALQGADAVQIAGFGTFKVGRREARMGRNPQTGAPIRIEARNVPKFSAGKALKEAVN